ncbi:hypothetical protein X797_006693 [Metarhizium robertsii]|uniref:Uncharacterized protein n=1 Tax=Metarhizium robertsii TaxID=568076 RepID=A0A0A1UU26_9HYPO|nr:hypothetical protein X797_006693 [Metarhizium robertsii]
MCYISIYYVTCPVCEGTIENRRVDFPTCKKLSKGGQKCGQYRLVFNQDCCFTAKCQQCIEEDERGHKSRFRCW